MTSIRLDPDRTWFKSPTLLGAIGLAIYVTTIYADIRSGMRTIQQTIESDAILHEKDRTQIVASVDAANATIREVRDELRKLVSENVSLRQSGAWLDLFQLTIQAWVDKLRSDNPGMKVPDLKVPALPR